MILQFFIDYKSLVSTKVFVTVIYVQANVPSQIKNVIRPGNMSGFFYPYRNAYCMRLANLTHTQRLVTDIIISFYAI